MGNRTDELKQIISQCNNNPIYSNVKIKEKALCELKGRQEREREILNWIEEMERGDMLLIAPKTELLRGQRNGERLMLKKIKKFLGEE